MKNRQLTAGTLKASLGSASPISRPSGREITVECGPGLQRLARSIPKGQTGKGRILSARVEYLIHKAVVRLAKGGAL